MKIFIVIREFNAIGTLRGCHARAFLNEDYARDYLNSVTDLELKRLIIHELHNQ